MLPDNFFSSALAESPSAVGFEIGRALRAMHPRRVVHEIDTWQFNPVAFCKAGHATRSPREDHPGRMLTYWTKTHGVVTSDMTIWNHVRWQEHTIDLIDVGVEGADSTWLIADSDTIARDFVHAVCEFSTRGNDWILVFEDGYFSRDEALENDVRSSTFDNIILPEEQLNALRDDFTRFIESREIYKRYNIPWKRGAIFMGPAGNGKTHAIKAVLNLLGLPCLYVKSLLSSWGTDHHAIRTIFSYARTITPCILVFEDLDTLATEKNRSMLLNELDGFASNTGIITLASSNHPEKLDPALLDRPSRFDRKYPFKLPVTDLRARYLSRWNEQVEPDLRLSPLGIERVAQETEKFSFAYMKELTVCSTMAWIADPVPGMMDKVMLEQAQKLREQLGSPSDTVKTNQTPLRGSSL